VPGERAPMALPNREVTHPPSSGGGQPFAELAGRPLFAGLSLVGWLGVGALIVTAQAPLLHYAVRGSPEVSTSVPFVDDFERGEIGDRYFSTGGHWRIEDGMVHSPGVKNNPLWLKAPLPAEVAIEFSVRSDSSEGDIKCELFGNGRDHASGYVLIFGGWSNSLSVIARLDEHGKDRKSDSTLKVEKGRTYRFRIERRGGLLRWYADGRLMMEYDDPEPLRGRGHDRFGFSSWEADVFFDDLSINPL